MFTEESHRAFGAAGRAPAEQALAELRAEAGEEPAAAPVPAPEPAPEATSEAAPPQPEMATTE